MKSEFNASVVNDEIFIPEGFEFNGMHCGIKSSGNKDLALVKTVDNLPVLTTAVFTTNECCAAPVIYSKEALMKSSNKTTAVLLNSGNANAATGEGGLKTVEESVVELSKILRCDKSNVLVCSTGLIGIPLDSTPIVLSAPTLVKEATGDRSSFKKAAEAILTTDTVSKVFSLKSSSGTYTITGFAKGAAMLAPSMATMLAVVVTDADLSLHNLKDSLINGVQNSFNSIVVDGCMSTNDTVILMSSGKKQIEDINEFNWLLQTGLRSLAYQMVKDAEGSTVTVHLTVEGCYDYQQAKALAHQIAQSVLVRCSINGKDPYWGRIISELGAAGVNIKPENVSIFYGDFEVARGGVALAHDEDALSKYMQDDEIEITVKMNLGEASYSIMFCDISHAYIDENRKTS